jgi:formylglycine-generating enzyme required for sulfatase activity
MISLRRISALRPGFNGGVFCSSTLAMVLLIGGVLLDSPATAQSKEIKTPKTNPKDGLTFVWIPPGNFTMGCSPGDKECFSEEMPAHHVTISKGFWIGQTEVTVLAYEHFAGFSHAKATASSNDVRKMGDGLANEDSMPIVVVTWDEARDYCKWSGGRLPTEAEWEYAARGGSAEARYGDLDQIAWYQKNSNNTSHQVSQKRANAFGLFDVLGNAWEWVNDWYDGTYYAKSPEVDPVGPENGTMHGLRGGSWMNSANLLRVSDRGRSTAELRFNYFGMRCVLDRDAP